MAPAPTAIHSLSLHDALPICPRDALRGPAAPGARGAASGDRVGARDAARECGRPAAGRACAPFFPRGAAWKKMVRSEEHTSELQSQSNLVCRLLLEKKKKKKM